MQIELYEKTMCGTPRYYPMCDKAELFCEFFKSTKSIPLWAFTIIRRLGYKIIIKEESGKKYRQHYPIGYNEVID